MPWKTRMATRTSRVGAMPDGHDETVKSVVQSRKNREASIEALSATPGDSEPCMWGSATLVTLVSTICITVTSMTETVMAHLRAVDSSAVAGGAISAGGW